MEKPNNPASRQGEKLCVYCGSTDDLTKEHPFPTNLFLGPKPTLITVPACRPCNKSYDLDDEYFRLFAATPAYDKEAGRQIWDETIVARTFKRSPKLRAAFVSSPRTLEISSPGGLYLGEAKVVSLDRRRVNRVFEKIARGLFRHHLGRRLPTKSSFTIITNVTLSRFVSTGLLDDLGPVKSIGNGSVAQYRFAYVPESPESSVWLVHLYQTTMTVIFVDTPEGPH